MMRVENLRKVYRTRFGENVVLDKINFDLKMGERLGILGRNGAGKSTLVRLISGAELPTSGIVKTEMSVSWPIAFGGAFQPNLTGIDNVRFISRIYGQDAQKNLAFVEDFAELGPYLREEVRTYSSGMRARLAFAISMIIEFDCFLIDEVGAVGDARFHERCNHELFAKRGDRAMVIISHDASYVRDHCNRFAVLHDGALVLFDDFDEAYADFRVKIGLEAAARPAPARIADDRSQLIEATHTVAVNDEAFRVAVQQADWHRDERRWKDAEAAYASALELYPYQRSYWVQKGHCAKEAGADLRAEIAYRSAIALGEPEMDVREHLAFVMDRQGKRYDAGHMRSYQKMSAPKQPPAMPDIALLARAAWGIADVPAQDAAMLLQTCESCDQLLAAMIEDDRFDTARAGRSPALEPAKAPFTDNLIAVACAHLNVDEKLQLARTIRLLNDVWPALLQGGGFSDWPQAMKAMGHNMPTQTMDVPA